MINPLYPNYKPDYKFANVSKPTEYEAFAFYHDFLKNTFMVLDNNFLEINKIVFTFKKIKKNTIISDPNLGHFIVKGLIKKNVTLNYQKTSCRIDQGKK